MFARSLDMLEHFRTGGHPFPCDSAIPFLAVHPEANGSFLAGDNERDSEMKDALAEKLLVRVMGWDRERVSEERPLLQDLAEYKYDEYQQYSAGMRFIESLALWLRQFESKEEREVAYRFVKEQLVFLSAAEMHHFVRVSYPDHIRQHLLRRAASRAGENLAHLPRVAALPQFRQMQRQCLFLGLSDGSRIDQFRRANQPELSHEQIFSSYELSDDRVTKLLENLDTDITGLTGTPSTGSRFTTVVLLDDFTASGRTYYMPRGDGTFGGKLAGFHKRVVNEKDSLHKLLDFSDCELIILFYGATESARRHIVDCSAALWSHLNVTVHVEVVQKLPQRLSLDPGGAGPEMVRLIRDYYDPTIHDSHMQKGGTEDSRYGFAGCGLPLVLYHNTPNNSVALLSMCHLDALSKC